MAKGLGNNPLENGDSPLRKTEGQTQAVARNDTPQVQALAARLVPKSMQLDSLLNERLRRCAFETRVKEAQIFREALHEYLAKKGF